MIRWKYHQPLKDKKGNQMKDDNNIKIIFDHELALARKRAKEFDEMAKKYEVYGCGSKERAECAYWTGRAEALETVLAVLKGGEDDA